MDPIIDKRAELAYLMTLRDQAAILYQKLLSLNESVQLLEKEAIGTPKYPPFLVPISFACFNF